MVRTTSPHRRKFTTLLTSTATEYRTNAQTAYDCMKAVLLNTNDTTQFLDHLTPYYGFQPTLAYLKETPASYSRPSVDILGGLQTLRDKVTNGTYSSQYDLDTDLNRLVTSMFFIPAFEPTQDFFLHHEMISD